MAKFRGNIELMGLRSTAIRRLDETGDRRLNGTGLRRQAEALEQYADECDKEEGTSNAEHARWLAAQARARISERTQEMGI